MARSRRLTSKRSVPSMKLDSRKIELSIFAHCRRSKSGLPVTWDAENVLLWVTLASIILGTVLGIVLNPYFTVEGEHHLVNLEKTRYLQFPGELFMRMLKLMIVPLVVSSNISSAASISARSTRYLSFLSILYYLSTTIIAVVVGSILTMVVKPGNYYEGMDDSGKVLGSMRAHRQAVDSAMDLLRNLIPENIVEAAFRRETTRYRNVDVEGMTQIMENNTMDSTQMQEPEGNVTKQLINKMIKKIEKAEIAMDRGANILGLISFSIFFGFGLGIVQQSHPDAKVVEDFFTGTRKVMVFLISIVIWFSPIGIMSLIAEAIAKTTGFAYQLRLLGMYSVTVSVGLGIHGVIVLPLLLFFMAKKNPLHFTKHLAQALLCAVGTASSVATLPCTANCLENNIRIHRVVSRFMLPLGTTVNMDGTALFQAVAVIFTAQCMEVDLTPGTVVLIIIMVCLVSIATASVPSAGVLTMMLVLESIGIPAKHAAMILPVDWCIDRIRTAVNVYSNAVGVAVIAQLCHDKVVDTYGKPIEEPNSVAEASPNQEEAALGNLPDVLEQTQAADPILLVSKYNSDLAISKSDKVTIEKNGALKKSVAVWRRQSQSTLASELYPLNLPDPGANTDTEHNSIFVTHV